MIKINTWVQKPEDLPSFYHYNMEYATISVEKAWVPQAYKSSSNGQESWERKKCHGVSSSVSSRSKNGNPTCGCVVRKSNSSTCLQPLLSPLLSSTVYSCATPFSSFLVFLQQRALMGAFHDVLLACLVQLCFLWVCIVEESLEVLLLFIPPAVTFMDIV